MGEKLSFYKLVSEKDYTIEIPIIQRDYAQGRESASEIRHQFLLALHGYLSQDTPVELDFIYGSIVANGTKHFFTPLDGQQRLTTLFLLHWYLALQEDRLVDFRDVILSNNKAKFSYATRTSSRDFCYALIANNIPTRDNQSIAQAIENSSWFFSSWFNDPTVKSMLIVIDEIDHIFKNNSIGFYKKLVDVHSPIICFQFIELENFGLTDSLYVKMNSRGKELTDFENFKAKFEQYIIKIDRENGTNIYSDFSKKIDVDWTHLFWNYRDPTTHLFDTQLMNFIRVMAINHYALKQTDRIKIDANIRLLTDRTRKVSFSQYEQLQCFDKDCLADIVANLDFLKNGDEKVKTYLKDNSLINEASLFEKVILNQLNYTERILFYSLYKYLIANNGDTTGLFDWIRIIRNLAVNTIYNDADMFSRSIKSVNQLLPFSSGITTYLATSNTKIDGFAEIQIEEERTKAMLIVKGDKWKEAILKYEQHGYFIGQIDFLLKFSGIKIYYKTHANLNWEDKEDKEYFDKFTSYGDKASAMFTNAGLSPQDNYLWQRALLSKGDYLLLTANGRNKSFLTNDDRDTSWKRLLRDDTHKRDYLQLLFDDIEVQSVEQDLQTIIDSYNIENWRLYFIKRPRILNVCGYKKFIRFDNENDILLLEKSQTNGLHREYYTYALKVHLEDLGNQVLYTSSNSVDYWKYISGLNGKKVSIVYSTVNSQWQYRFRLAESQYEDFSCEEDLINYLKEEKYIN